jgi:hypothetical protein
MICLTGDLHHMGLKTGNQSYADITEIQIARKYLYMLEDAGVKVTFFVTGKAFADEWKDLKPICQSDNTEIVVIITMLSSQSCGIGFGIN